MASKQALRWTLATALACALLPAPAAGQAIRSPYRYLERTQSGGLFAGYVATDRGSLELGPGPGPIFGARYGIRLSGPFAVEGEVGLLPTSRYVVDLQEPEGAETPIPVRLREADISLLQLMAALRFNLTGPRTYRNLQPYLLAGAGAAFSVSDEETTDLDPDERFDFGTTFAGQLGGGIEWFAMRRLALRLDGRLLFWELDYPRAFSELGDVSSEEWVQNFYFSVGAAIHF